MEKFGVVRYVQNASETEIVENGIETREEAERLCAEYNLSERNNPNVEYIIGQGLVFKN